jgi:TrmH family RNA methyltransferase
MSAERGAPPPFERLSSRANPLLAELRRLRADGTAYRRSGRVWLEGEHLGDAMRQRGVRAAVALLAESALAVPRLRALAESAQRVAVLPDALFGQLSALPSPAGIGFVVALPPPSGLQPAVASLVLDRVQDAGNVGSLLRSAAAFGVRQVLALRGTAGLWSPKVLRAGMGAHFALALHEGLSPDALSALALPLVATSSHAGAELPQAALPQPCAWVLGHEGQGVDPALLARCTLTVRIPQPGGEESLNVAAAGAVCLYESARRAAAAAQ